MTSIVTSHIPSKCFNHYIPRQA